MAIDRMYVAYEQALNFCTIPRIPPALLGRRPFAGPSLLPAPTCVVRLSCFAALGSQTVAGAASSLSSHRTQASAAL